MASMLTVAPRKSSRPGSRGGTVTSLSPGACPSPASSATCPRTSRSAPTNALTGWAMPLWSQACANERRMLLPSRLTSLPELPSRASDATHAPKHDSDAAGSSAANTRPKVS